MTFPVDAHFDIVLENWTPSEINGEKILEYLLLYL